MNYYLTIHNQTVGPMTANQIFAYPVDPNTPVNYQNTGWRPLYTFPDLMQMYQIHHPQPQNQYFGPPANPEINSKKVLFGILALILGSIGVQYFAIGKIGGGFLCILLTLVTCGLWEIVTLIQGIMVLCISDQDFANKFLNPQKTFPVF